MNAKLAAPIDNNQRKYAFPQAEDSEKENRKRLSPLAIKAVKEIFDKWKLTQEKSAFLLGDFSVSTWDRMVKNPEKHVLTQDQMTRASAFIGIFNGLHNVFADEMADRWVTLQNSDPLFQFRTPIEMMQTEGIQPILETLRYVEALENGL